MWLDLASITIEPATLADDADLAKLHGSAFARGWDESDFAGYIANTDCLCLVARRTGPFGSQGLLGLVIFRKTIDEVELLSIAVTKSRRGQGIGRRLLEDGLRQLYGGGANSVFLEVAETDPVATSLYRSVGFREISRREGYYREADGSTLAALVMKLDLR